MFIDKYKYLTLNTSSGRSIRVRLTVNPRAKKLILRLDQKKGEAVAVAPSERKLKEAAAFARAKLDWIASHLEAQPDRIALEDGALIPLRGRPCKISLDGKGRLATLTEGDPQILALPGAPETLPARAIRALKTMAKGDLADAVARHAANLEVRPARISIKDTKSRWGSCSHQRNLSFSWRLILAEPFVLDYVAAHEVAHILEMNH
jgi:predicted metal-dependent hydrolase